MYDVHTWNRRYQTGDHSGPEPDPFLQLARPYLDDLLPERGRTLDLAGGAGRNAVFAAEMGFDVTLVDFAENALRKAADLAAAHDVSLRLVQADLEAGEFRPEPASFDLILVFFYLELKLLPTLRDALRPGGLLIYRTYTIDQRRYPGRPKHPMHLLAHNELLRAFDGFRVLMYEETLREKGVASLLAQKPAQVASGEGEWRVP